MEIINEFVIHPVLLIAQIVNFLIILYILKRFAYKPILELLKKREEEIKKGLSDAQEARELLEKAEERERELLRKAQSEAKKLLDDARKVRDEMMQKSQDATRKEADRLLKEAREQISFETREAEKRLSAHVSDLAIQFLERSIEGVFDEKDQDIVMRSAIKRLRTKKN